MRKTLTCLIAIACFHGNARSQTNYFPPLLGTTWDTLAPSSLGWCPDRIDSLYAFLDANHTKGFMVLKDGKIVLEKYFGTFTQDSIWYWASAGKTLTAMLVGIAQEQGFLDINDPTSNYLGTGWTSCTAPQELAITVRHQLTMTTGLDDGVLPDNDCTDPACLQYLAAPGTRWAYHNAPYTLLREVIQAATGMNENQWTYQRVGSHIGMSGLWVLTGWNNVFFSRTRDMARYGLLLLNRGIWDTDTVLHDQSYFDAMTTSSQTLNESYGYLTWLNGQSSFMVPGVQFQFPGSIVPNAPADMFMALGKNDQKIHVVPSQGLVVVRMGNAADTTSLVPIVFDNELWARLNDLDCTTGIGRPPSMPSQAIHYDATMERVIMGDGWRDAHVVVCDATGRTVIAPMAANGVMDMRTLPTGAYLLRCVAQGMPAQLFRFVK